MFLVSLASCAATSGAPDLIVTTCSLGEACEHLNEVLDLDDAGRERLERALDALQPGQVIEVKHHDADAGATLTSALVLRVPARFEVVTPFDLDEHGDDLPTDHPSGLGYVGNYDEQEA